MRTAMTAMAAALTLIGGAAAQEKDKGKAASQDETFVLMASESGMAEVATSELALEKATSAEVKKFAKQMIDDHTKANKELKALATKAGYSLAASFTTEHKAMMTKLKAASGESFDALYIKGQVKDHVDAVALFKKESENGKDADLKAWAAKTLPHLEMHLKMAKGIHDKLGTRKE